MNSRFFSPNFGPTGCLGAIFFFVLMVGGVLLLLYFAGVVILGR